MISTPSNTYRHYVCCVALVLTLFITCASGADELEPVADQPAAEDFSLSDLDEQTHRLSDYAGKVVLVSFWATWCPECIFEMPSLRSLSNTLSDHEFIILAINVGEEKHLVRAFAEQHNLKFPIVLDHDLEAYKKWPVLGVPTSFVINQRGKIVYAVIGAIEWTNPATVSKIRALFTLSETQ